MFPGRIHHAIVRNPGENFAHGITTSASGAPDLTLALHQHSRYCKALESLGIALTILEADPRFPDGCFVEDTAIVTGHVAIITQPGHPARAGEQQQIGDVLSQHMPTAHITGDGTVDGGDILRVDNHFYIGRSGRTNAEGAQQLARILSGYGFTSSEVPVAAGLHLKSSATCIGPGTLLATPDFAEMFAHTTIVSAAGEDYAANCLCVNDVVIFPTGFPGTKEKLIRAGYTLLELDMSEFQKMDGGLTCLSLLIP